MLIVVETTREINHHIAQQRDKDLRNRYLYQIANFNPYYFVFVDDSGCDGLAGHRRRGWAPKGTSPIIVYQRKERHILSIYTQYGITFNRVYYEKKIRVHLKTSFSSSCTAVADFPNQNLCCGTLLLSGFWPEIHAVQRMRCHKLATSVVSF
jgi:hypothetical protein